MYWNRVSIWMFAWVLMAGNGARGQDAQEVFLLGKQNTCQAVTETSTYLVIQCALDFMRILDFKKKVELRCVAPVSQARYKFDASAKKWYLELPSYTVECRQAWYTSPLPNDKIFGGVKRPSGGTLPSPPQYVADTTWFYDQQSGQVAHCISMHTSARNLYLELEMGCRQANITVEK